MYQGLEKSTGQRRNFSFIPIRLRVGEIWEGGTCSPHPGWHTPAGRITSRLKVRVLNTDLSNARAHNHCVILSSWLTEWNFITQDDCFLHTS